VYSLTNSRGKYNVETNYQQRFSDAKIASKTIIDGWMAMAARRTGMPVNGQSTA
jgi:hypothetical protein